jgi:hypothetical protein
VPVLFYWALQTQTPQQRAARDAQWTDHALIVADNPRAAANGAYIRAGIVNDAPYGRNPVTGWVLYFKPSSQNWRISTALANAAGESCVAATASDGATTCVPEGAHQWTWFDNADYDAADFRTATVRVTRVPEAEARTFAEVRVGLCLYLCICLCLFLCLCFCVVSALRPSAD